MNDSASKIEMYTEKEKRKMTQTQFEIILENHGAELIADGTRVCIWDDDLKGYSPSCAISSVKNAPLEIAQFVSDNAWWMVESFEAIWGHAAEDWSPRQTDLCDETERFLEYAWNRLVIDLLIARVEELQSDSEGTD